MRAVLAFFRSIAVAAFGLVTSLLTVILVTLISAATGFNVFTFSLWVVIPVGAVLTGLVAASGYYFGSRWLSHPPSFLLLAQIILIAAATYLLIYSSNTWALSTTTAPLSPTP